MASASNSVLGSFAAINTRLPADGSNNPPIAKKPVVASYLHRAIQPSTKSRELLPAPPKPVVTFVRKKTSFYDLPAELRIEIYRLVLEGVTIHIMPPHALDRHNPHALVRTSWQVRNEVLPMIHRSCEIRANVTDFNFDGLLAWLARIPPDQHRNLTKNNDLRIRLCTTNKPTQRSDSLRRWLHARADPFRPQPAWRYSGPIPKTTIANDLRRRAKRMTEQRKRAELVAMLEALGITVP